MKKYLLAIICLLLVTSTMTGCFREADRVSDNLSLEADNFNIVRQITVINCRSDAILYQMTGRMSIEEDKEEDQLEIVVEGDDGVYHKHFAKLNEWTTYIIEDLGGANVDKYKYTLNYNPNMILPVGAEIVD